MNTDKHSKVGIFLRGMLMGAADVVPGVSGGTMAFITGIYERLITAIGNISSELFSALRNDGVRAAWKAIDGNFLVLLVAGIITSIITLAQGVSWALDNYPPIVWAFFFGLIVASAWVIGKQVKEWSIARAITVILIAAATMWLLSLSPATTTDAPWFVFLSGMIAISAMILPGISGSFLLVLLGKYEYVLNAIYTFDIIPLAIFAVGCGIGLLSSARIISVLFKRFHDTMMLIITAIMIGSLYKVWPWRQIIEYTVEDDGSWKILVDKPVSPRVYEMMPIIDGSHGLVVESPYIVAAVIACIIGIVLVVTISKKGMKQ